MSKPKHIDADLITARRIVLSGSDGVARIMLNVNEDGGAAIAVLDMDSNPRLNLAVHAAGDAFISLHDRDGKARLQATLDTAGTVKFSLADGDRNPVFVVGVANGNLLAY
jgi:hypothetical protein